MLVTEFGASPFQTSLALAFMMLTMLPVSLLYPRLSKRAGAPALIVVAFTGPVVGFATLAAADGLWTMVAGLMMAAAGLALAMPSLNYWIVAGADDAVRGRAVGLLTTGLFAGQFFSPVLTQPIIDVVWLRPVFLGVAVTSALAAFCYAMLAWRKSATNSS